MTGMVQALLMTLVMGGVIFCCRAFPFLFFGKRKGTGGKALETLLSLAEKTAPPVAMTVLAFNAIGGAIKDDPGLSIPVLAASAFTALMHLWKRNSLLSIAGGVLLYMILSRHIL
jgi:branched-subunit amino acid transport protein AzlD